MKRILITSVLFLIVLVFICFIPISRVYIADYLEKLSLFLFRIVDDEDLNEWYEKSDNYQLIEESGGSSY